MAVEDIFIKLARTEIGHPKGCLVNCIVLHGSVFLKDNNCVYLQASDVC